MRAGKLRALGVTTTAAAPLCPTCQSSPSQECPGYEVNGWYGLLGPAATPPAVIARFGCAFLSYRRKGGAKGGVLPDFFIGAHAAVLDIPPLTRDTARYET